MVMMRLVCSSYDHDIYVAELRLFLRCDNMYNPIRTVSRLFLNTHYLFDTSFDTSTCIFYLTERIIGETFNNTTDVVDRTPLK